MLQAMEAQAGRAQGGYNINDTIIQTAKAETTEGSIKQVARHNSTFACNKPGVLRKFSGVLFQLLIARGKEENLNSLVEANVGVKYRKWELRVRRVARGFKKGLQSTASFR